MSFCHGLFFYFLIVHEQVWSVSIVVHSTHPEYNRKTTTVKRDHHCQTIIVFAIYQSDMIIYL